MHPERVLLHYPPALRGRLEEHPPGWSGARVWKVHVSTGALCLRASATQEPRDQQLIVRHQLLRDSRHSGLTFVPAILDTSSRSSFIVEADRSWELMEWMPGVADFHANPSDDRLRAAARGLARVHLTWNAHGQPFALCPGILRRLDAVRAWNATKSSLRGTVEARWFDTVEWWMPRIAEMLREFHQPMRLQPCLRDVWHDHLLFIGDQLTGLIDYAAVGIDHVAVDLGRMLGSLVEDDDDAWQIALSAYREIAPLSVVEERFARQLDRTGTIVALANWLRWSADVDSSRQAIIRPRLTKLWTRTSSW